MPRRFFRKFALNRDRLHNQWYLAPVRHLMRDNNLWGTSRRSVVPAFAVGLFVAFVPFPGHMLIAMLIAIAMRINIPVAALTTLIVNPLTMGPLYYFTYRLGLLILGLEPQPFEFEMSLGWVKASIGHTWRPLLLGSFLVGTATAAVGYFGLNLLWRISIANYLEKKRSRKVGL